MTNFADFTQFRLRQLGLVTLDKILLINYWRFQASRQCWINPTTKGEIMKIEIEASKDSLVEILDTLEMELPHRAETTDEQAAELDDILSQISTQIYQEV